MDIDYESEQGRRFLVLEDRLTINALLYVYAGAILVVAAAINIWAGIVAAVVLTLGGLFYTDLVAKDIAKIYEPAEEVEIPSTVPDQG